MDQIDEIRNRIAASGIDRREIAKRMGLAYSSLCTRIGGFVPWRPEQLSRLEEILSEQAK